MKTMPPISAEEAVLLFAHGSRDPDWARPVEALRTRIAGLTCARVDLAYLEYCAPTLAAALAQMAGESIRRVHIVPVFIGQGAHLRRDLPALVDTARQAHPELRIELLPAIGEQPEILEAIAHAIAAQIPGEPSGTAPQQR